MTIENTNIPFVARLWKVCSGLSFSMGTLWNLCPTSFCRFQKQLQAVLIFYFGFIFCFEGWPLVLNLYFVSFPVFCFEPLWFECWPLVGDNLWPNGETDGGTALDLVTSGCLSINNTRPNHKHWGICQQTTNSGEIIKQRFFFQNLILITCSPFYSTELCCNVESWCDLCLCHCRCLCHCHHCLFIFVIAIVFLLILIIIMITSFPFYSSELCWITSRRQVGKFKVKQGTRLPRKVPIFFFFENDSLISLTLHPILCVSTRLKKRLWWKLVSMCGVAVSTNMTGVNTQSRKPVSLSLSVKTFCSRALTEMRKNGHFDQMEWNDTPI